MRQCLLMLTKCVIFAAKFIRCSGLCDLKTDSQIILFYIQIMKFQNILFALVTTLFLASCSNPLQKQVDEINKSCPMSYGNAGTLKGAELLDDRNVCLNIELNSNVVQTLQSNTPMARDVVMQALSSQSGVLKELFDEIIRRGGTFSYRFTDKEGKKEYTQVVTTEELKAIQEQSPEVQTPETALLQILNTARKEFPVVTNVMIMDSLVDDGDYVRYYATVDTLFERLTSNPQLHDNLMYALTSGRETLPFINAVLECEKGIAYRYTDRKSGKVLDVLITNEELDKAMGN